MPYTYITPASHGHGSLPAAVASVIADLEPGQHYFYGGDYRSSSEVAADLLMVAARGQLGEEVPEMSFSRNSNAEAPDEFRIVASHRLNADEQVVLDGAVRDAEERFQRASGAAAEL